MEKLLHKNAIRGALAIVLAAILRSLDGTFLRPQLYSLQPELVVFVEHLLGTIVFAWLLGKGWRQVQALDWKGRGALVWVSVFGGILGTLFITKAFFMAFDGVTTFATVIILQKLQPLFALGIAAVLLRERLAKSFYLRAFVAVVAAYILAFGFTLDINTIQRGSHAAVLALVAAFAFGSSTVFGKFMLTELDSKRATGMRFFLTTILMGAYLLISGDMGGIEMINDQQRGYFLLIVMSSGALALFLYYYGLQKIQASQATILELAWPLSAVFLDWIINGNTLTGIQAGAAIVMIIAMLQVAKQQGGREHKK